MYIHHAHRLITMLIKMIFISLKHLDPTAKNINLKELRIFIS